MPAGLGGSGYLALTFETTMGSYLPPTTAGTVFIPILSESLAYREDKYYSPAIRQQVVVNDVQQSFYHIEGDVTFEVDTNFLPYWMYMTRHNIVKTGSASPWEYVFTPSNAGSASTGTGANARSASIAVIRNGVGFGYAGCVLGGFDFTIEDGVLKCTAHVLGLSETTPAGLGTPTWTAPDLLGASSHSIYVAASGASPTWGSASVDFNGFTFSANHNAAAQNRIISTRGAAYISFGESEITYNTELDFMNKTEYDAFKAATTRAIKLESIKNGANYAATTDGLKIEAFRTAYETYDQNLGGMGDLIMATVTGKGMTQTGASPYKISVQSAATIT